MRSRAIVLTAGMLLLLPWAVGQTQTSNQDTSQSKQDNLPSAPSAVKLQEMQRAKAAANTSAPPANSPQPANSSAPAAVPASDPSAEQPETVNAQPVPPPAEPAAAPAPPPAKAAPPSTEETPLTTIRKRVDEVNVIFTVTDKHGRYVKNLAKTDF